jgi:hypothetical protein
LYNEKVVPIYEQYSIDDTKFHEHRNDDINSRLYTLIQQSLNKDITKTTGYTQKEIIPLLNKYPKNKIQISNYNKLYTSITTPDIDIGIDNYVVVIPEKNENKSVLEKIISHLQNKHTVIILGDSEIHFQELNFIDTYPKMLNMYQYIMNVINKAKMVVCPVGN